MRIVIAEDDAVSRAVLSACVQGWDYQAVAVDNGLAALDLLTQPDGPRLALLDWEMPGLDGIEVCTRVRATADLPFRYIVVLTGRDREEDIVAALEKGADDYIKKPWTAGEFRARLDVGRRMVRLHEQIEESNRILAVAAKTDYLTRIWNRSAVLKRLEEELSRAAREKAPLSVIMVDVDHFKRVNDTHGHGAGDQVLVEVARRLTQGCRPYDVVGRYGGEEFLAVVPRAPYKVARMIAERFRNLMAGRAIDVHGLTLNVTISLGCVWLAPGESAGLDALVNMADEVLYQAKKKGRNRVEMRPSCEEADALKE